MKLVINSKAMSLSSSSIRSSTQSHPSNIVVFGSGGYGESHTTFLSFSPQPKCKKSERLIAVCKNLLPSFKAQAERKEEDQTVEFLQGRIRDLEAKNRDLEAKLEIMVMQESADQEKDGDMESGKSVIFSRRITVQTSFLEMALVRPV